MNPEYEIQSREWRIEELKRRLSREYQRVWSNERKSKHFADVAVRARLAARNTEDAISRAESDLYRAKQAADSKPIERGPT